MKRLFLLLTLSIFSISCQPPKYREGDIVYLKPDSTIGTIDKISGVIEGKKKYSIYILEDNKTIKVSDNIIFGKKK